VNPVTRRLLDDVDDPALAELALAWDALEELVVQIYRQGGCSSSQAAEFTRRRRRCRLAVRPWLRHLDPHWRAVRVAGDPATKNPFEAVLAVDHAEEVCGNWALMQQLPAAREALNGLLLARAAAPLVSDGA